MPELNYPWTQVIGTFPGEAHIQVSLSITHDGDSVDNAEIVDAVKSAIDSAGASSVTATTYAVTSTPA